MAKNGKSKSGLLTTDATIAQNRRARYDYALDKGIEAGIQLYGTEVKSLRLGHASINEAYVQDKGGDLYLLGASILEYQQAGKHLQHAPTRPRRLLLHKRELDKLIGAVRREGYTIIPTRLYFNARGLAKVEIALAKGKKLHDKRETEKQRDWNRQKTRLLKS